MKCIALQCNAEIVLPEIARQVAGIIQRVAIPYLNWNLF